MRELIDRETADARVADAAALFRYQVKRWIGAFAAALGGVEALVFAGGGEVRVIHTDEALKIAK